MQVDDLILVSVDDHVVEPPDLFEGRAVKKADRAARRSSRSIENGRDVWMFEGAAIPNVGLNAVAGRVRPRSTALDPLAFDEMRAGCYDIHERIRDMNVNGVLGSLNFPSLAGFCGTAVLRPATTRTSRSSCCRRYNDWHIDDWCGTYPGRMIPLAIAAHLGRRAHGGRGRGASPRRAATPSRSRRTPSKLGYPSFHSDHWDPFLAGVRGDRHRRVPAHRFVVADRHHGDRRADRHDDHAPAR